MTLFRPFDPNEETMPPTATLEHHAGSTSIRNALRKERRDALARWRKWVADRTIPKMADLLDTATILEIRNPTRELEHDMGSHGAVDRVTSRDKLRQDRSAALLAPWGGDRKKLQAEIEGLEKRLRELQKIDANSHWSKNELRLAVGRVTRDYPRIYGDAEKILAVLDRDEEPLQ
jgi:hypothetical protein